MLIGICLCFAAVCAVALCLAAEAFASLQWLWLLPLGFLGGVILAALLALAFICVLCAIVPMDVLPEKDSPFYRKVTHLYIKAIQTIARLRVYPKGLEQTPRSGRFLLVCNHTSDLDPAVLMAYFNRSQLAFVSKRENDTRPLVGPLMRKFLCQPINRENDREALKTILRCVRFLEEDKVSVAVFPEGYTSLDGKLRHFRNGVFKIALKARVPIVVCTLKNTRQAMHDLMHLKSSEVWLELLRVIPYEELKGKTTGQIGDMVYEMMAENLGPENIFNYGKTP